MIENSKALLIGDNPFHGISHLSQERSRERTEDPTNPEFAANLVCSSLDNGANGFMFSVSETTLSILRKLSDRGRISSLSLYAIVPYAYEYVRLASQYGGLPGLARKVSWEILASRRIGAAVSGLRGILFGDLESLMKAYLTYELSRIEKVIGKKSRVRSILLHEVITDMALALDLDWLFQAYVKFLTDKRVIPGFNTCNFTYLVHKLRMWGLDLSKVLIAAPFNKVGFQMCPSKLACENALGSLPEPIVIAISVLAAGYLRLPEAAEYIGSLPNVKGVAVGVSKESHTIQTFKLLQEKLS
jgi:hypothetical protein